MLDNIDYKALSFWLAFVQTAGTIMVFAYAWITNRQKVNASAIKAINDDIKKIDKRLIQVESDVEHLPTHQDMAAIHNRINETAEGVNHINGQVTQINQQTQLIVQHLLNQGK
tara:strand:- start:175 stop:513 length:339 start_codon:yes stop_codon:yes gene_type:complete